MGHHSLAALLALLVLIGGGCAPYYHESMAYWEAPEHRPSAQWLEIPATALVAPMVLFTALLYPFEMDKERPSFIELGAVMRIMADPARTLATH